MRRLLRNADVWIIVLVLVIALIAIIGICRAGEKEEIQARLVSLLQEERAMNAEFQLYQLKLKDLQDRFPEVKKEQKELTDKLKALQENPQPPKEVPKEKPKAEKK